MTTISESIDNYLASVARARSANTARSYKNGLEAFQKALEGAGTSLLSDITTLTEDVITWHCRALKKLSPPTERVYLAGVVGFFEYLSAERLAVVNMERVRLLAKMHGRRNGHRIPKYPRDEIERLIEYITTLEAMPPRMNGSIRKMHKALIPLRDRALLLVLADTGLRIHEACNLRIRDIDWPKKSAVIIGKGDKEARVLFSARALDALRLYLDARAPLDSMHNGRGTALPAFSRHDRGAGLKVQAITKEGGYHIVKTRAREALGEDHSIHPHVFRHYFITNAYKRSGGDLLLASKLARHSNVSVTQRYAHLVDAEIEDAYREMFDQEVINV